MEEGYTVPVTDADRIRAGLALQLAAAATGVTVERMTTSTRLKGRACRARWLAMYTAYVSFGWPIERVAHAFGLNRATAAAACRWAEEGRENAAIDALLERLELCVSQIVERPACELPA
ncbi:MAG: chromosomal replication initiator DnaA [Brevundimonas sp.]